MFTKYRETENGSLIHQYLFQALNCSGLLNLKKQDGGEKARPSSSSSAAGRFVCHRQKSLKQRWFFDNYFLKCIKNIHRNVTD